MRKVHPDLFASGPAGASEVNDDSLKTIQGVLDAVTKSKSIPDAGIKRLRFYVRDESAPEGTRVVPFTFKTTGGDCRNLVARQLTQLFDAVGVPSAFKWEPGDWEHSPKSAENASNRGDVAEGWNLYPSPEDTRPTRERHPPPPLRRLRLHRPRPLPPGLTARGAVVR